MKGCYEEKGVGGMDGTLAVQIVWFRQKSLSEKNELALVLRDDELFQSGSFGKHLRWRDEKKQGKAAYSRQVASVCSGLNGVTFVGLHHPGLCRPLRGGWGFY